MLKGHRLSLSTALSVLVVAVFIVTAIGVAAGWWAQGWRDIVAQPWLSPGADHWFGTNRLGQDVFDRAVFSSLTTLDVGLGVSVVATALGAVLGALAGFRPDGWVDALVLWLVGVLEAIPFYLFVAAVAVALQGEYWALHAAMVATFWTATARIVRAEVIRIRNLNYIEAAYGIGLRWTTIIFNHVLPNAMPVIVIQATLTFVAAIKAEVILSFLGLGIPDRISWGSMLRESTQEIQAGHFQNFLAASIPLFVLVLAVNRLADALQDHLDPAHEQRAPQRRPTATRPAV